MAVTNLVQLNPGQKIRIAPQYMGTGAPADSDTLATDTVANPKGTTYYDITNHKQYFREAVSTPGVAADFKSVTYS
jgi:hypothetical protein